MLITVIKLHSGCDLYLQIPFLLLFCSKTDFSSCVLYLDGILNIYTLLNVCPFTDFIACNILICEYVNDVKHFINFSHCYLFPFVYTFFLKAPTSAVMDHMCNDLKKWQE